MNTTLAAVVGVACVACLTDQLGAQNPWAAPGYRTDTVLSAADIDGSGRPDYVVREVRPSYTSPEITLYEYRFAVYLDAAPGARTPQWANDWQEDLGDKGRLTHTLRAAPDAWVLAFSMGGADADLIWVVVVERGKARLDVEQQIDYGEGNFELKSENGRVTALVTTPFRVRGVGYRGGNCDGWNGMHLTFDAAQRRFAIGQPTCVPRRFEVEPT